VSASTLARTEPWRGLAEVPPGWGPCVVTIGVFDGVHRGHASLIDRAVRLGRESGVPTVLATFDPHPARVVGPPRDTAALSTPRRRAWLASGLGVDAVLVLPFTPELAATPAEEFVGSVLVDGLGACAVVVGSNFRFGARAAGDVALLRELGARHGFTAEGVELLHTADVRCSSSHVRLCLALGDVTAAARALGRPHRVEGRLDGHLLAVPPGTAVPASGRYLGLLTPADDAPEAVEVVVDDGTVAVHGAARRSGVATLDFVQEAGW
jgi:riboflavin kinase/FMN adenylyltransferase